MLFFLRAFPSYGERLRQRDERLQLSGPRKIVPFLLFILFNAVCLPASLWYRLTNPGAVARAGRDFAKYFGTFGYWFLTGAWHKAMEGVHFRKVNLVSPSLEVGFCRGNISALHFEDKQFDFGSEYLFFEARKAQQTYGLWKSVFSDDLHDMALKDESIATIISVHVIDHVERLDDAMRELARVLQPGGRLYFSGFSDRHFRYSLIWRLLALVNRRLADRFADLLARRRGSHNLLTPDQWRAVLAAHGLKLEQHRYTESGPYAYLCYFLHFVCFSNFCFEFDFIKKGPLRPLLERLFRFYYLSIGAPEYLRTMTGTPAAGDNFFAVAIKQ